MTLAMPQIAPPPSPPPGNRRRLRVVGVPARVARIARLAVLGLVEHAPVLALERARYEERPRFRSECESGPRPCPFVSCRYHLALGISRTTGQIRLNYGPELADGVIPPDAETCALDVAERGRQSQETVARLLHCIVERVRQIEREAERNARSNGGEELAGLLREFAPDPIPTSQDGSLGDIAFDGGMPAEREVPAEVEAKEIDDWAEQVAAYVRAKLPLRMALALASHEPEDEEANPMVTKSTKNKGKAKKATEQAVVDDVVKKGATSQRPEEVLLGKPFTGRHPVTIDQKRRDKVSEELVAVLGDIDEVNAEKSAANGDFNGRLKELREKQHELAEAHRTSKEKQDVKCQQYLTRQNEVLVRRLDTNEIVERRTATPEELEALQVPMFGGASAPGRE